MEEYKNVPSTFQVENSLRGAKIKTKLDNNQNCPYCRFPLVSKVHFCPNCGKMLAEPALPITVSKQIVVCLISFFLPPLGLWPGIKYLRQSNPRAKKIGLIAILLTVVSLVLAVWISLNFIKNLNRSFQEQIEIPGWY